MLSVVPVVVGGVVVVVPVVVVGAVVVVVVVVGDGEGVLFSSSTPSSLPSPKTMAPIKANTSSAHRTSSTGLRYHGLGGFPWPDGSWGAYGSDGLGPVDRTTVSGSGGLSYEGGS